MSWITVTMEFDSASQSALDQHTQALALLTVAIQHTGVRIVTAISDLTNELTRLTQTESTLATAVQAVVNALQIDATKIAQLTDALAVANSQNDNAAIDAIVPQLDALASKFAADAQTLQGAIPPPQP